MIIGGAIGAFLGLWQLIMFSIYQFAAVGFTMGLLGLIMGVAYLGYGASTREKEAEINHMAAEL